MPALIADYAGWLRQLADIHFANPDGDASRRMAAEIIAGIEELRDTGGLGAANVAQIDADVATRPSIWLSLRELVSEINLAAARLSVTTPWCGRAA